MTTLLLSTNSYAADPVRLNDSLNRSPVLSFRDWRYQQILESRQRLNRVAEELTRARVGKSSLDEGKRVKHLKSELKIANHGVEMASRLSIEDYFDVYLAGHILENEALVSAAKTMNQTEVAELLRILLKTKGSANSREMPLSKISDLENLQKTSDISTLKSL